MLQLWQGSQHYRVNDKGSYTIGDITLARLHVIQNPWVELQHIFWKTVKQCSKVGKVVVQGPFPQELLGNNSNLQEKSLGSRCDIKREQTTRVISLLGGQTFRLIATKHDF